MVESDFVYAADLAELTATGIKTVQRGGHTIVLVLLARDTIYAVDNRCPRRVSRWTRAPSRTACSSVTGTTRFDLASGGTFDQWADDVRLPRGGARRQTGRSPEHRDLRAPTGSAARRPGTGRSRWSSTSRLPVDRGDGDPGIPSVPGWNSACATGSRAGARG
ncbi:MAG: hypothetical protein R2838_01770 [Caldilineaceae bacterium]